MNLQPTLILLLLLFCLHSLTTFSTLQEANTFDVVLRLSQEHERSIGSGFLQTAS